jgi:hypothetical protein
MVNPSAPTRQSGERDFDFFIGTWQVTHHRLKTRLADCDEWATFAGTTVAQHILGGLGNIDDNVIDFPDGLYRAITLRTFNTATAQWSIWWLDGRQPSQLDTPVMGRFVDNVGTFYAEDTFNGQPIRVRFLWQKASADGPRWEQAFSANDGVSWETNWIMVFTPMPIE